MYLTDSVGNARFLCFDLDSHGEDITDDVTRVVQVLSDAGIPYVTCASGTPGSHHIWVALAEPVPHALAVRVYDAMLALGCPSLDRSATNNARTGAVRPPLSPHRSGPQSRILHGTLDELYSPTTTRADVEALIDAMERAVRSAIRPTSTSPGRAAARDDTHAPYVPGAKRPLAARITALLDTPPRDASATLYSVMLAAAHAHWHLADVAEILPRAAFEHIRTRREGALRMPRSDVEQRRVLARQWERAVAAASVYPVGTTQRDADAGEMHVADAITHVRTWMDATPARWSRRGGASDRLVLDALLLRMAQAVSLDIEAAQRSLATLTPLSHEGVGKALRRLVDDGPLQRGAAATGTRGHHWVLSPEKITPTPTATRQNGLPYSQGFPRPPEGGSPLAGHVAVLRARTSAAAHDAFVGSEAGTRAAVAWGHWVTERWRADPADLQAVGALHLGRPRDLDEVAAGRKTAGTLRRRQEQYQIDQYLWRWWNAEVAYLRMTHAQKGHHLRHVVKTQATAARLERLLLGRYPRQAGQPDHSGARVLVMKALTEPPVPEPVVEQVMVVAPVQQWNRPRPASRITKQMLREASIDEPLIHVQWLMRRGYLSASTTLTVQAPQHLALPDRTVAAYTADDVRRGLRALEADRDHLWRKRAEERAERKSVFARQRSA